MPPFVAVPNHPYAEYRTYNDGYGRFWIECRCTQCDFAATAIGSAPSLWRKQCMRPELWQQHVYRYATLHTHDDLEDIGSMVMAYGAPPPPPPGGWRP